MRCYGLDRISLVLTLTVSLLLANNLGANAQGADGVEEATMTSASISLDAFPGVKFMHTASSASITSNWTEIDHPLLNGNPNAVIHVTQNWNPGTASGVYNDHVIGVWYDKWPHMVRLLNNPLRKGESHVC